MIKDHLCIATITLARNEAEKAQLCRSLHELAKCNLPVYITDGGSDDAFLASLKTYPNFIISDTRVRGVFYQAKHSLKAAHASGKQFIFYTEPDKNDFFANGLIDFFGKIKTDEHTGVVNASRSEAAFNSFPPFQQMTETTINNCCAELTGIPADYTYGPFLMHRDLVPHLEKVTHDIGWGWRPFVFGMAARKGLKTGAVTGAYFCPADQREDNAAERIYRMRQLKENIDGIVLSTQVALD